MTTGIERFAQGLHEAVLPLTELLYESFAEGRVYEAANTPPFKYAGEMNGLRSYLVRLATRESLATRDLGEWSLSGNPNLNGQLNLTSKKAGINLRVLKVARSSGKVPVSGRNGARRAYWKNTPLPLFLQPAIDPGLEIHNLILTWEPVGEDEVALQIVRPVETGRYGNRVNVDFVMELAPQRSDFEKLVFQGEDVDDEDLFSHEFEKEDGTTKDGFAI